MFGYLSLSAADATSRGGNGIEVGDDTIFAPGAKIISENHDPDDLGRWKPAQPVHIRKRCWIGANAVILPAVELGDDVVVGAGAVVTRSFAKGSILAGAPARTIHRNYWSGSKSYLLNPSPRLLKP
jgi:acetyltransferase-like isoleucine patch superfamily enzyme